MVTEREIVGCAQAWKDVAGRCCCMRCAACGSILDNTKGYEKGKEKLHVDSQAAASINI